MLLRLAIRDFVIVDELELEFSPGFTVFSGETGAGKSILIDALALTLGERADASVVREGAQRADVSAEFATTPEADAWLAAQELGDGGGDQHGALLRRSLDSAGRSKAWINGAPATLTQLRELGDLLVDIHGQQAHQSLLRAEAQRTMLDSQGGLTQDARGVSDAYRAWQKIAVRRKEIESNSRNLQLERDRLEWQVKELSQLGLKPGEWHEIQQEHQRLAHAASLIEGAQAALDALIEAEGAILGQLASLSHKLGHLAAIDAALKPVTDALEPAEIHLQDAVHGLKDYLARVELDPDRLTEVEARIDAIHSTSRKFRIPPDQLPAELERASEQLAAMEGASDLETLIAHERAAEAAYRKLAEALSKARGAAAKTFGAAVTERMQSLSMAGGRFDVALNPAAPSAHGVEQVEFVVAAHPGATLRPLAKVASGGELARISLAISVIAAAPKSGTPAVPTLIFDEVDSGIGGAVAEVVGKLLRQLGQTRQVLCVTHLPQVAAQGEAHFAVSKATIAVGEGRASAGTVSKSGELRTVSRIRALDAKGRIDEVARMLGGIDITPTTRQHARELLTLA